MNLEYDGSPFYGWQRQNSVPTIQGALEAAIFDFCQQPCTLQAAGRTDKGVHACAQCAHADLTLSKRGARRAEDTMRDAVNFYLSPLPVAVLSAEEVDENFHARFSAVRRSYLYRVFARNQRPVLSNARVWHYRTQTPLDVCAMREGARHLVGTHDFSSFRGAHCQAKSPIRTLERLRIEAVGEAEVRLTFTAPSFLYHQVRLMTSALVALGAGHLTPREIKQQRETHPVANTKLAPAHGLFFLGADYPDKPSRYAHWAQAPQEAQF